MVYHGQEDKGMYDSAMLGHAAETVGVERLTLESLRAR